MKSKIEEIYKEAIKWHEWLAVNVKDPYDICDRVKPGIVEKYYQVFLETLKK